MSHGLIKLASGAVFADDFKVVRPLGSGGMGAVYVAEQLSTGTMRALKLMREELTGNPKARARFVREAKVSGRIASEHVVQVVAAGVDAATNVPWLAMELLDGEDFGAYLGRKRTVSPAECVAIFTQLGHALSAAHAAGVVHRDLKPENIFLAVPKHVGVAYTVKVLDFGIARVSTAGVAASTGAIGTPLWMAPEQTDVGSSITEATDLWPLGLIAFRALVGKNFWKGGSDPALRVEALLRQVLFDPIPPASLRAKEIGADVKLPEGFDGWFARCVNREPEARFASVEEAVRSLREALGDPEEASPLELRRTDTTGPTSPVASVDELDATVRAEPIAAGGTHTPFELSANDSAVESQSAARLQARQRTRRIVVLGATGAAVAALGIVSALAISRDAEVSSASATPAGVTLSAPPIDTTASTARSDPTNGDSAAAPPTSSAIAGRYQLPARCSLWHMLESWKGTTITTNLSVCREGNKLKGWKKRNSPKTGFIQFGIQGEIDAGGVISLRDTKIEIDQQNPGAMRCLHTYTLEFDDRGELRGTSWTVTSDNSECKKASASLYFRPDPGEIKSQDIELHPKPPDVSPAEANSPF